MSEIRCGNCGCGESSCHPDDWFQCPDCGDWICQDNDPDDYNYPYCMVHNGTHYGVCADCCIGYENGCFICANDYCDDCSEPYDDCECDDDD